MATPVLGEFMEVGIYSLPTKFDGSFIPYAEGHEPKAGAGAQTETGIDGRVEFRAVSRTEFVVSQFWVEAWLEDANNNQVLKASWDATHRQANQPVAAPPQPAKKSWVLDQYIEAERYYGGQAPPNGKPPKISRDRLATLWAHEVGHYRISRLVALDCLRAVRKWALTFRGDERVGDTYFKKKILALYQEIKSMLQFAYDVATKGSLDAAGHEHWMTVLNTAEETAAGPEYVPPDPMENSFWPGLQSTLGLPPRNSSPADIKLSGELLNLSRSNNSPESTLALAKFFSLSYEKQYDAMFPKPVTPVKH